MARQLYWRQKTGPLASFLFLCLLVIGFVTACTQGPQSYNLSGATMGTTYSVKVITETDLDLAELQAAIEQLLLAVNQSMSTYIADSEISKLNQWPTRQPFPVSVPFMEVLQLSDRIYRRSQGAFDPTVGPLVNLWGFGPEQRPERIPEAEEIRSRLGNIGFDKLVLNTGSQSVTRTTAVQLDLSAIAKGYGVDRVSNLLIARGLSNHMVEIGGELRVSGHNLTGEAWRIAVESPTAGLAGIQRVISISDRGIATSGDYRNYFEEGGRRYSHTIDPRTGRPIDHNLASVTVVMDNAAEADGLATAMMVLGAEKALVLADSEDIPVLMVVKGDNGFVEQYSKAFKVYLKEED